MPRGRRRGPGAAVPVGVAAQPRRAADLVDLVEGDAPGRAGRRGGAVLHPHHAASVLDRPGPVGLGAHAIATFAGHTSTDSRLRYIHLSGRELSDKLNCGMAQIHSWRVSMLTEPVGGTDAGGAAPGTGA